MNDMFVLHFIPARSFPGFELFDGMAYFVECDCLFELRVCLSVIVTYFADFSLYVLDKCCTIITSVVIDY